MPLADEYFGLLASFLEEWVFLLGSLLLLLALRRFGPLLDARPLRQRAVVAAAAVAGLVYSTLAPGTGDLLAVNVTFRLVLWLLLVRLVPELPTIRRVVPLLAAVDGVFFFAFSAKLLMPEASIRLGYMFKVEATVEHFIAALLLPVLELANRMAPSVHGAALTVVRAVVRQACVIVLPGLAALNYAMFLWLVRHFGVGRRAAPARPAARGRSRLWLLAAGAAAIGAELGLFWALGRWPYVGTVRYAGLLATLLPIAAAAATGAAVDRRRLQGYAALLLVAAGLGLVIVLPRAANFGWLQILCGAGLLAQAGLVRVVRHESGDMSLARVGAVLLLTWAAPAAGLLLALLGVAATTVLPAPAPPSDTRRRLEWARVPRPAVLLAGWLLTFGWMALACWRAYAEVVPSTAAKPLGPAALVPALPPDPWATTRETCAAQGRRACSWREVACQASVCQPDGGDYAVATFGCERGRWCPEDRRWPGPEHQQTIMAFEDEATGWRLVSMPARFYPRGKREVGAWPRQYLAPSSLDELRAQDFGLVVFCCDGPPPRAR